MRGEKSDRVVVCGRAWSHVRMPCGFTLFVCLLLFNFSLPLFWQIYGMSHLVHCTIPLYSLFHHISVKRNQNFAIQSINLESECFILEFHPFVQSNWKTLIIMGAIQNEWLQWCCYFYFHFQIGNYYECKCDQSKWNEMKFLLANTALNNFVNRNSNISINKFTREYTPYIHNGNFGKGGNGKEQEEEAK